MENSTQYHVEKEAGLLKKIEFDFTDVSEIKTASVVLKQLIIAGWAGRDHATNLHHIEELKALGVAPPRHTPMFYRLGKELLSNRAEIQVAGEHSSGEAEAILVHTNGQRWVGIGSDHTDRKVEAYGVTVSKQMCPKPIGRQLWNYDDIQAHWDELVLRSYTGDGQEMHLYQEGPLKTLLHPEALVDMLHAQGGQLDDGSIMFCGTVAAKGGIRAASAFRVELHDPVLGRTLSHQYNTVALPIAD